jgi:hypothetical protein
MYHISNRTSSHVCGSNVFSSSYYESICVILYYDQDTTHEQAEVASATL